MKRRSWQIELPHIGEAFAGTCSLRNSTALASAVDSSSVEALTRSMPRLEAYFHYRNLDVSTLKELVKRWKPEVAKGLKKEGKHEALADILDSIEELKYYRRTVMTI